MIAVEQSAVNCDKNSFLDEVCATEGWTVSVLSPTGDKPSTHSVECGIASLRVEAFNAEWLSSVVEIPPH